MGFLRRSKSQKVGPVTDMEDGVTTPQPPVPEQIDAAKDRRKSKLERRTSIFDRSRSADPRTQSMDRPRTANRVMERNGELQTLGETIEIQAGGDTFSFPTPSPRLPPNSAIFHAAPAPSPLTGGLRTPIGVALGSPSQVAPSWGRSLTSNQLPTKMDRHPPPARAHTMQTALPILPENAPSTPQLRKKKSSWKTLGSLFHRQAPKLAIQEPFYKVRIDLDPAPAQAQPLLESPTPSPGALQSPASISSHHSRTPSATRGMARFEARAEADRASFMPNIESKMMRKPSTQRMSVKPQPKHLSSIRDSEAMFTTLQEERHDSPMSNGEFRVAGAVPRTPRLDMDIPGGEMERYSVMFEKLLEPRQSILERRQSKMKRLKSNAKKVVVIAPVATTSPTKQRPTENRLPSLPQVMQQPSQSRVPQRSVTSPHLTRVPSLVIALGKKEGMSAEEPVTAIHRPRPIQRSKTAPPGALSPAAPNFSRPKPPTFASSDGDISPTSPLHDEDSLPPTPTTMTTITDDDNISHDPIPLKKPRHVDATEPSWDMLTSKAADLSTNDEGGMREPYPRVRSPEDLERHMVQVSVARQVSVSRARRHVQKAVASKQPLKPRVVELSKNRKSTFVVIESGDD